MTASLLRHSRTPSVAGLAAAAVLPCLAFPPINLTWAAWVAYVPILVFVTRTRSFSEAFVPTTFVATLWYLYRLDWMRTAYTAGSLFEPGPLWPCWIACGTLAGVSAGVFLAAIRQKPTRRHLPYSISSPLYFLGAEITVDLVARMSLLTTADIASNALTQVGTPFVRELAGFGGRYLVAWSVFSVNGIIADVYTTITTTPPLSLVNTRTPLVSFTVLVSLTIAANISSHPEAIDTAVVAAVPVPFAPITESIDQTTTHSAELTIWPEQALTTRISNLESPLSEPFNKNTTAPSCSPVLAGCTRISKDPVALRNSAVLFDAHGTILSWVDKRFPTPLTECEVPLQRLLGYEPATFRENFTAAPYGAVSLPDATVVGVGICHDVCHPEWASTLIAEFAPTYLVTLASEQFDRRNIASDYLLRVTRLRALECGRAIVRCVGMGRPTQILPNGECTSPTDTSTAVFDVPEYRHLTSFASWGDAVFFLTAAIHIAIALTQVRYP